MKTNDRIVEHKEYLLEDESDLSNIFQLGIVRTLWKSHILNKINELRVALNLEPRTEALPEATYDQEAVNQLSQIDFSSLGQSYNAQKRLVLTFAGIGLNPVQQDDAPALLGDDDEM